MIISIMANSLISLFYWYMGLYSPKDKDTYLLLQVSVKNLESSQSIKK